MGFADAIQRQRLTPIAPQGVLPELSLDRAASSGSSDIRSIIGAIQPFINNMRTADLQNLQAEQQILNNPAMVPGIANPMMRNTMNPEGRNVIYNAGMSEYQKANLGLEREKMGTNTLLEREKLAQSKNIGEERLKLQEGTLELNKLKNEQIYETKIKEMERKTEESESKLKLAQDALVGKEKSADALAAHREALIEATNARHALDLARRDAELAQKTAYQEAQIADMQKKLDAASNVTQTTAVNDDGTEKTVTTQRGSTTPTTNSTTMVSMRGPDNKIYNIPADKVKDAETNYKMKRVK